MTQCKSFCSVFMEFWIISFGLSVKNMLLQSESCVAEKFNVFYTFRKMGSPICQYIQVIADVNDMPVHVVGDKQAFVPFFFGE